MKILLIMDPYIPVPPPAYGGHERLVHMFEKEYARQGHEVALLAGPGSTAERPYTFGKTNADLNTGKIQRFRELMEVWLFLLRHHRNFDLIHNFGRLLYLLPVLNRPIKKIMSYGRDVTGSAIRKVTRLPNKNLVFTACSNYCVNTGNTAGKWATVYNAIEFSKYTFTPVVEKDAPLMFLGRIEAIKGTHTAVQIARATNNRLWIGGNIAKEHEDFFKQKIEPFLDDRIVYLGPLNDEQKDHYLGRSKALLFPIEWDEPFGMVMVEAMACGTPVIAFSRGSVPEVVDKGETGIIVQSSQEMEDAVNKIYQLDRATCRQQAQKRFDVSVIAQDYLMLFTGH